MERTCEQRYKECRCLSKYLLSAFTADWQTGISRKSSTFADMTKSLSTTLTALILLLVVLSGCNNELEPYEPARDIPVVYGFLSIQDTAHYIRVEKAFLDESVSAFDIARIPDSIYYDEVIVQLEDRATGNIHSFTKVNGEEEGYPRDSGIFVSSPNYLYKLKLDGADTLQPNREYRLIVDRGRGLPLVTATTRTIGDVSVRQPNSNFSKLVLTKTTNLRWEFPEQARLFDVFLRFVYREQNSQGQFEEKVFLWKIISGIKSDDAATDIQRQINLSGFYEALGNALDPGPIRTLPQEDYLGFNINAYGFELEEYLELFNINSGLTSAETIPVYTNLEGDQAVGIFSSRYVLEDNAFETDATSLDSLRFGQYTKDLGFSF